MKATNGRTRRRRCCCAVLCRRENKNRRPPRFADDDDASQQRMTRRGRGFPLTTRWRPRDATPHGDRGPTYHAAGPPQAGAPDPL
jgi:hypothetical protein